MANRKPNTACDLCETPIYRRPKVLANQAGKFCSRACRNRAHPNHGPRGPNPKLAGKNNPAWKGGAYTEPGKGYRMIRMPKHPRARQNGYVLEHILVAEEMLGRPLAPLEVVHHINHVRDDNRPENLKVYATHREHWVEHHMRDCIAAKGAGA